MRRRRRWALRYYLPLPGVPFSEGRYEFPSVEAALRYVFMWRR
jgi:hypothetical protein